MKIRQRNGTEKVNWISHRGLKDIYTENTAGAFDSAVQAGFTHLETDLRLTRDGHIVLSHDACLERVTGRKINISAEDRKALEQIQLPCGQGLLFFDEFVERYAGFDWVFDCKPECALGVVDQFEKWIKKRKAQDWIFSQARFLFWAEIHEAEFRKRFPEARTLARARECWRAGLAILARLPHFGGIKAGRSYSIRARFAGLSLFRPEILDSYHKMGASVIAFLPSDPTEVEDALNAGVDEILTDGPRVDR